MTHDFLKAIIEARQQRPSGFILEEKTFFNLESAKLLIQCEERIKDIFSKRERKQKGVFCLTHTRFF